jgi:AcrR family transcriptional regulator
MARRPRPGAHDALLEAAREEFARGGVARARVEDIARRAGISKGAFYLHFRTKDEALREIVHRFLGALEDHARRRREVEERVEREHARDAAGHAARFEAECAADADLLELLWRHRQIVAALDAAGTPYREILADFRRRMRALVANRILERQRAGALRPDVAPEVCGDLVVGAYDDFSRRMVEMREKPDLAAWARSLLVVLYEGILARPAPALARRAPSR